MIFACGFLVAIAIITCCCAVMNAVFKNWHGMRVFGAIAILAALVAGFFFLHGVKP